MATKRTSTDIHAESSSDLELSEHPEKMNALSDFSGQSSSHSSGGKKSSSRMWSYKDNLLYDPKWKLKYPLGGLQFHTERYGLHGL